MGLLKRSEISIELIDRLSGALEKGESVVVIGPRHTGKTYLIRRLIDLLQNQYSISTYACSFYMDYPMQSQREVADAIKRQVPIIPPSAQTISEVFKALKEASSSQSKPIVLILAHFDGVARDIGRQILREIRPAVISEQRSLVVLVSGESNIVKLVRGPDSEFTCSHEYLVQGFDLSIFTEFFTKWTRSIGVSLSEETCEYIWKVTHGNTSLFRRFLDSWVSGSVSGRLTGRRLMSQEDIDAAFDRLINLGIHGTVMFQWASELISSEPDCWPNLEDLIAKDHAQPSTLEPTMLELAGAAELKAGKLRFSSPVMRAFIKKHFGYRQIADLYAQYGEWDEAFRRYARAEYVFPRPASYQEQFIVESITRRLCATFKSIPLGRFENHLIQGVRGTLGFEYVSWWRKNGGSKWTGQTDGLSDDQRQRISEALSRAEASVEDSTREGIVEVEEAGLAMVIAGNAPGSFVAFVAADLFSLSKPNQMRTKLLREIFHELRHAYHEKLNILRQVRHQRINRVLAEIARNAYASLFVESHDSVDVLRSAAKHLYDAKIDFQTVFCATKTDKDMVFRVLCCYPGDAHLESLTWNMDEDSFITRCARETAQRAGLRSSPWPEADFNWIPRDAQPAAAALPLQSAEGLCTGVLCVLYEPGFFPEQEEFKRLNEFAGQLSAALQQGRRVALLQSALDHIPEPIVLFDAEGVKQYANAPAEELLGVTKGWKMVPHPTSPSPLDPFLPMIIKSMQQQQRLVDFIDRLEDNPYRGLILADALTEDGSKIGALLHIQDENYYRQIIEAYISLEQSFREDEALRRLLAIFHEMGHKWIRKYRVDGTMLVLDTWIESGVERSVPDPPLAFAKYGPFGITWRCIDDPRPFVFCFDEQRKTGDLFYTKRGLLVIAVGEAPGGDTLRRQSGDYWLDFPLMRSNQEIFGKLSIPCDATLSPERFEMFCVFSRMAGDSFKRMGEIQKVSFQERDQWAEAFVRDIKIRTKEIIQQLDIISTMYLNLENDRGIREIYLSKVNTKFAETLKRVRETIDAVSPHGQNNKALTAGTSE